VAPLSAFEICGYASGGKRRLKNLGHPPLSFKCLRERDAIALKIDDSEIA
jgi:hypothetical protein